MATDWTRSYRVGTEVWEVDPSTMSDSRRLYTAEDVEVTRDLSDETLGSGSMTLGELLGEETWVRVYLSFEQPVGSGRVERVAVGTFMALTTDADMDGKGVERKVELHTPLKELADDMPPAGLTARAGTDAVAFAARCLSRHHARVAGSSLSAALPEHVTASDSDSWLTLAKAVLSAAGMELTLDPYGTIGFAKSMEAGSMAEVWTFADDRASILHPEVSLACDFQGVPNAVEITASGASVPVVGRYENDDPASQASTASRGRTVLVRESSDSVSTPEQARALARSRLADLSASTRRLSYSHGYCPVRLGDCVRLSYAAHSVDVKARVVKQVIRCATDLTVQEEAEYEEVHWGD